MAMFPLQFPTRISFSEYACVIDWQNTSKCIKVVPVLSLWMKSKVLTTHGEDITTFPQCCAISNTVGRTFDSVDVCTLTHIKGSEQYVPYATIGIPLKCYNPHRF